MRISNRPHEPNNAEDDGKVTMDVIKPLAARRSEGDDRDHDDVGPSETLTLTNRWNNGP